MAVGVLRCVVINVTDLTLAYKFWGAVTGLEIIGSEAGWHDWLGYLGTRNPWKHEIILQRVDNSPLDIQTPEPHTPNQVHIDITPNDGINRAIEEIIELGGTLKKPPSLYPRPGSRGDEPPLIDWQSCKTRSATSSAWSTTSPKNKHKPPWQPPTPPPTTNGEPQQDSRGWTHTRPADNVGVP